MIIFVTSWAEKSSIVEFLAEGVVRVESRGSIGERGLGGWKYESSGIAMGIGDVVVATGCRWSPDWQSEGVGV